MNGKALSFASQYSVTRNGKVFKGDKPIALNDTQFGGKKCEINGKTYLVHRLVASAYLGMDINDSDTFVQHGNDNQQVNTVSNLSLGTNKSNTDDKVSKDRQHKPEGALNSQSKLTAGNVSAIKNASKTVPNKALAKKYGVSEAQISRILSGNRW